MICKRSLSHDHDRSATNSRHNCLSQVFPTSVQADSTQHATAVVGEHGSVGRSGVPVCAVSERYRLLTSVAIVTLPMTDHIFKECDCHFTSILWCWTTYQSSNYEFRFDLFRWRHFTLCVLCSRMGNLIYDILILDLHPSKQQLNYSVKDE